MEEECDHEWEWFDESFDHEYGTEVCAYWECSLCGAEKNDDLPDDIW